MTEEKTTSKTKSTRSSATGIKGSGGKARAAAAVKAQAAQEAAEAKVAKEVEQEEFGYTLRCSSCARDGIFFARNPMVHGCGAENWFSSYKDLDASWPAGADIYCQHTKCGALLRVDKFPGGQVFPYERFVVQYPRAVFENMLDGGIPRKGKTMTQKRLEGNRPDAEEKVRVRAAAERKLAEAIDAEEGI